MKKVEETRCEYRGYHIVNRTDTYWLSALRPATYTVYDPATKKNALPYHLSFTSLAIAKEHVDLWVQCKQDKERFRTKVMERGVWLKNNEPK